jgi:hypothetical protein
LLATVRCFLRLRPCRTQSGRLHSNLMATILDRDVRHSELKVVPRPVLEGGAEVGALVLDGEVGKQHAGCVGHDEDAQVEEGVQVGEVEGQPGRAEHSVRRPQDCCHHPRNGTPVAQPLNTGILISGKHISHLKIEVLVEYGIKIVKMLNVAGNSLLLPPLVHPNSRHHVPHPISQNFAALT